MLIERLDHGLVRRAREAPQPEPDAFPAWLNDNAIHQLERRFPGESAIRMLTSAQKFLFIALGCFTFASAILFPLRTLQVLAAIGTLFFGVIVFLRIVACINILALIPSALFRRRGMVEADQDLPVYTVLVPLYDEANVLRPLTQSLCDLDYPASRLDIKLVLEQTDAETRRAARSLALPRQFEIVVVPDAFPQTKPKALNYALQMARGDYVVVYDAEDRPEPDQLRKALAAFAAGPPNLACLQARLTIYNGAFNWLTKQFSIEYGALFRGILPTYQNLGLPIPLGGTSNHFRISALRWLGGWDAFNVTEDADLGMRLFKHGYICRMLDSDTGEEATSSLRAWLKQRTRWLKGWMQTWLVHTRRPLRLLRKLGTGRFIAYHLVVAGMIFSALLHPIFWLLLVFEISANTLLEVPASLIGVHLWLVALFNVAMGYMASMLLSLVALRQTRGRFAIHILSMPAYWLLISAAAYYAVWQLCREPYYWAKTRHGVTAGANSDALPQAH